MKFDDCRVQGCFTPTDSKDQRQEDRTLLCTYAALFFMFLALLIVFTEGMKMNRCVFEHSKGDEDILVLVIRVMVTICTKDLEEKFVKKETLHQETR